VKPIEHQLRPKGLGLGADRSAIRDLEPSGPRRPPKPGDERKEETLVLGPGGHVLVESGAHKDLYGKVRYLALFVWTLWNDRKQQQSPENITLWHITIS
jgi:hypothetical protein